MSSAAANPEFARRVVRLWDIVADNRQADDVLRDLNESDKLHSSRAERPVRKKIGEKACADDTVLLNDRDRAKLQKEALVIMIGVAALGVAVAAIAGKTLPAWCMGGILGWALGYLGSRLRRARLVSSRKREMEFYLPIVMERVVMAVQAGLDVLPALKSISELALDEVEGDKLKLDPVTRLLDEVLRLSERGMSFETALRDVAERTTSSPVKHAFLHLAVAQREGGELRMPLRELSDATQLYYQETIEEEIARLPIKATMPLILTFLGLIICFLTTPLMQLSEMTTKAAGGG